jgi:hypothetical protein
MPDLRCPACGQQTVDRGNGFGYCHGCKMEFDSESDGDVTYGDPARIVERREQRELEAKERRHRRNYGR